MHSPEHHAPDCSCPCPDCEARAAHHPHDHPQAIADERDPVTPELASELSSWRRRPHGTAVEERPPLTPGELSELWGK